ncbi:Mur ligase [Lobosporangium transversale]|uniref:Dihydrofolate synthetase n=1 Tax=Lobosporangium transversale TaxID=64571 RepID=A0A1Y2GHY9_9FUNG|nr:Mur ligase [Lobosporangium transversale]ORZ08016.1 Mur ligase [Lobosporangium transversale]|eukprot:XP_021878250.1 Mur ligase [Lobosporangium transversale]
MDLGLNRVTRLLEALKPPSTSANAYDLAPHLTYPIIHVAGTNGKGSICAYISSILQASGFRVGRYNSPHLITPRDTIQINNQPISQSDYDYVTEVVRQKDRELELKATSFEILTAVAFYWFAYERVDIAVIEVGVGGRLDATNVVPNPKVCVIASIGMDHGTVLGNTIEEIASEKAGIIKQGVPVVVSFQVEGEKVYKILEDKAISVGLPLNKVIKAKPALGHWAELEDDGFKFWLPLLGDFQLENAAAAIRAIDVLRKNDKSDMIWSQKITEETIRKGMEETVWPGRLQWVEDTVAPKEVNGQMLIDGAHNPAAAVALRSFVNEHVARRSLLSGIRPRIHWIVGLTKGKDIEEMFDILLFQHLHPQNQGSETNTFSAVEFTPPEGMPWVSSIAAQEVCDRLTQRRDQQKENCWGSLEIRSFGTDLRAALAWVGTQRQEDDVVILCGSLYLVADLFRLVQQQRK